MVGRGVQVRHFDGMIHRQEVAIHLGWVYPLGGGQHWRAMTLGRLYLRVGVAWGRHIVEEARGWACTDLNELPPRRRDIAEAGGPGTAHYGR